MHKLRVCLSLLIWSSAIGSASAQTVISESFRNSSVTGWTFGNNGGGFNPTLTTNLATNPDSAGNGWLRLTSNGGNQATYARSDQVFNGTNATISVQFSYATWNGTGADGITFFLADASKPVSVGAYGGSLGYAQKTIAGGAPADINGMNGGYIGLGIDEYGNYSNATEGRVGGIGAVPNAIAVRGPGQGLTGYEYLGGTTGLGTALAFPGSTTRPSGTNSRTVQVVITATNQMTVYLQAGDGTTFVPLYSIDLSGYARPDQLIMGFTGSTGGSTDIHEIRDVTLTSVAARLWSNAAGTGTWGPTGANWSGGTVPPAGADVLLDNTYVHSAQTIDVGAGQTRDVRSIQIDAPFSYTLNNGTIAFNNHGILGPSGILVSATHGSADQTINSNLTAANDIEIKNAAAGSLVLGGTLDLGAHTATVDGAGTVSITGAISGTGNVTKNDLGTLILGGNNAFSGNLNLNAGEVRLAASDRLADGVTANFSGGTLNLGGFSERVGNLTLSANSTLNFGPTGGANYFLFTNLTGTPSGVLTVSNWEQGSDILASSTALSSAALNSLYFVGYGAGATQGAAQAVGTYGTGWRPISGAAQTWTEWDGSFSANWNTANNWTPANVPNTSGELASFGSLGNGQRAVTLNANETITGLRFDTGATGSYAITGGNTLTFAGPVAYIQQRTGFAESLSPTTIQLSTNTVVDMIGTGDLTIGAALTGSGNLMKENTGGRLILSGNSTSYTGNIYVDNGVLQITNGNALGSATTGTTAVANGAALELSGGIASAENITLQGSGIGNGGAIRNISGNNTLSGTLTLADDSRVNSDLGTLTISKNITSSSNANLTIGGAGDVTVSGAISTGGGSVIKDGAGTLTLAGANSYIGGTTVQRGTLKLGANNVLADDGAVTVASGATFDLNGYADKVGAISGAGTVRTSNGTLTLGAAMNLGGTLALNGGTLNLGGFTSTLGTLAVTADSILDFGTAGASVLSVLNSLTVDPGAVLTIADWTNTVDFFYAQFGDPGAAVRSRIVFTGFAGADTKWQTFDAQITPVPEPATYGALMVSAAGIAALWRRRRRLRESA